LYPAGSFVEAATTPSRWDVVCKRRERGERAVRSEKKVQPDNVVRQAHERKSCNLVVIQNNSVMINFKFRLKNVATIVSCFVVPPPKALVVFITYTVMLFSGAIYAQEPSEKSVRPKYSFGGGIFSNNVSAGGFADFSNALFQKNRVDGRNHFVLNFGALGETVGVVSLSHRLSFGFQTRFDVLHFYGYIENGIGAWGDNNKNGFFDTPVMYCVGAGGGINVFLNKTFSVFYEMQWIGHWSNDFYKNGPMFKFGWKGFF